MEADGKLESASKKEGSQLRREKRKIHRNLGGIRGMSKMPGAMVVIDVRREHIAVKEAQKVGVATVALIDTDSDPDFADLPIPGNDDAMRGIELVLTELADAVQEGKANRAAAQQVASKEGGAAAVQHRRARRATTSQIYEQQLTPTEQKLAAPPPTVLETVPGADADREARRQLEQAAKEAAAAAEAQPQGQAPAGQPDQPGQPGQKPPSAGQ